MAPPSGAGAAPGAGYPVGRAGWAEAAGPQGVRHQAGGGGGEAAGVGHQVPVAVQGGAGDRDLGQFAGGEFGRDRVAGQERDAEAYLGRFPDGHVGADHQGQGGDVEIGEQRVGAGTGA